MGFCQIKTWPQHLTSSRHAWLAGKGSSTPSHGAEPESESQLLQLLAPSTPQFFTSCVSKPSCHCQDEWAVSGMEGDFTNLTCRGEPLGPAELQIWTPHLVLIPVGGIGMIQSLHSRRIRSCTMQMYHVKSPHCSEPSSSMGDPEVFSSDRGWHEVRVCPGRTGMRPAAFTRKGTSQSLLLAGSAHLFQLHQANTSLQTSAQSLDAYLQPETKEG